MPKATGEHFKMLEQHGMEGRRNGGIFFLVDDKEGKKKLEMF